MVKNPALYGLATSAPASSGIAVSEETALESSAVWAAVRRLSATVAALPLLLYERLERGKERAIAHPLYNLLRIRPNGEMVAFQFRQQQMSNLLLWGNCYAEQEIDNRGRPVELWPLLPGNIRPYRRPDGELFYAYRLPNGSETIFPKNRVLHVSGFSRDGLLGYNVIQKQRESIGLNLGLSEYAGRFFANNARPDSVLEHPGSLEPKAKDMLRKKWEEAHGGLSNAHRVAILEEGMKLHEFSVNPEQAQLLESRKFSVAEVARVFGIPNHLINDLEKSSFSNIEEMSREFVVYSLSPWLTLLEQSYTVQLLFPDEQEDYFFEHLVEGLLRGQTQVRYSAYATARQWGWMSANDIRELENMNPIEDGDSYLVPMNMIDASMVGQVAPISKEPQVQQSSLCECGEEHRKLIRYQPALQSLPAPAEKRDAMQLLMAHQQRIQESFRPLFVEQIQRTVNREVNAIDRLIKKHLGQRDAAAFEAGVKQFYTGFEEIAAQNMAGAIQTYMDAVANGTAEFLGDPIEIGAKLETFARDYAKVYGTRYKGQSLSQIYEALKESAKTPDDMRDIFVKVINGWKNRRAKILAGEELVRAGNATARETYEAIGFKKLRWVATSGDSCPYCASLNGKIVGIDEEFEASEDFVKLKGTQWREPYFKHPPLHNGCVCMIVPEHGVKHVKLVSKGAL